MLRLLYAIRDSKMNQYNPPCVFPSDAAAIRAFGDLVTRDKDTLIANHPDDFGIYFLGRMDIESGEIQAVQPVLLANGSDFVKEN